MADKQERVFKPNMSKFFVMASVAVIIALWLIKQGFDNYKAFAPTKDASAIFPLGFLPIIFGCVILLVAFLIYISNAFKKITLTPVNIIFTSKGKDVLVPWKDLLFTTSPPEKKMFRQIILSNGRDFEKIDDFFFPDYEFLLEVIHRAKDASKKESFTL